MALTRVLRNRANAAYIVSYLGRSVRADRYDHLLRYKACSVLSHPDNRMVLGGMDPIQKYSWRLFQFANAWVMAPLPMLPQTAQ